MFSEAIPVPFARKIQKVCVNTSRDGIAHEILSTRICAMRNNKLISGIIFATLMCAAGVVHGQTPAEPAAPVPATSGGGGGGGAGHGAGVGIQQDIGGALAGQMTSAAFVYDMGQFRISGMFGMAGSGDNFPNDNRNSAFGLGANFYYVLHSMRAADLSIGGGAVLVLTDSRGGGGGSQSTTDLGLSGGLQIRAFVTDNVAAHANVGVGVALMSDDRDSAFVFTGNLLGGLGLTYFFR